MDDCWQRKQMPYKNQITCFSPKCASCSELPPSISMLTAVLYICQYFKDSSSTRLLSSNQILQTKKKTNVLKIRILFNYMKRKGVFIKVFIYHPSSVFKSEAPIWTCLSITHSLSYGWHTFFLFWHITQRLSFAKKVIKYIKFVFSY